jgi:NAD-dependent SIR2 family protein deacetylase
LIETFTNLKVTDEEEFTYNKLVEGLRNKKFTRICVLAGAGMSVAAGIPDFRTPGTGLYS